WLGLARAAGLDADLSDDIVGIQRDLFALGAQLADPADKLAPAMTKAVIGDADVLRLEQTVDRLGAALPAPPRLVLARGAPHAAPPVRRRAERSFVPPDPAAVRVLLRYLNRLSDLLFVLARALNQRAGVPEAEW